MKQARLNIWYQDQYGKHHQPQGKVVELEGKMVYLADFDSSHPFRAFDGFPIAKQIQEALIKAKIKKIIYRVKKTGSIFSTTPSSFTQNGWLMMFGGHEQYILPIKNWEARQQTIKEPKNLLDMDVEKWLKGDQKIVFDDDGGFGYL